MRILIWHGYLLEGSGSNVYTRELARTWSRMGHEVVVLCQEPHPERYDLGGAAVVRPTLPGPPTEIVSTPSGVRLEELTTGVGEPVTVFAHGLGGDGVARRALRRERRLHDGHATAS